jgi:hypothetical protein
MQGRLATLNRAHFDCIGFINYCIWMQGSPKTMAPPAAGSSFTRGHDQADGFCMALCKRAASESVRTSTRWRATTSANEIPAVAGVNGIGFAPVGEYPSRLSLPGRCTADSNSSQGQATSPPLETMSQPVPLIVSTRSTTIRRSGLRSGNPASWIRRATMATLFTSRARVRFWAAERS